MFIPNDMAFSFVSTLVFFTISTSYIFLNFKSDSKEIALLKQIESKLDKIIKND